MSLSFAVTAYNEMTKERLYGRRLLSCLAPAQVHDEIDEIVVVDDGSENFVDLEELLSNTPKVKLFYSSTNRGVFGNKLEAVACTSKVSDWVITCDSDNVMDKEYLDRVIAVDKDPQAWYCPSFAKPRFDYRGLVGTYNLRSVAQIIHHKIFACCANTGNQVVHRESFMSVFGRFQDRRADLDMPNYLDLPDENRRAIYWRRVFDACDSFIFNLEWLLAENSLCITEGMEYEHHYAKGEESNYARAPKEKVDLGRILLQRLLDAIGEEADE